MYLRKILVPTDFSQSSEAALAMASSLARDKNAKMLILHVHERDVVYTGFGASYAALPQSLREDAQQLLETVNPTVPGIDFERQFVWGTPVDAITKFAKSEDVDLIVLGTHGRTGFSRLLMGSVAESVMREAPCPVLTIKAPVNAVATQ